MWHGIWTAIITPIKNGEFDAQAFTALVERQITGGVNGLTVLGTTGESPVFDAAEREIIIRCALKAAADRVPIMVGCGGNNTKAAVESCARAKALGAAGALVVTPYYNKPTPEGLIAHYSTIAREVDIPLIVYNVPGRTGCNVDPDTAAKLSEIETVVAFKEASGNTLQIRETVRKCNRRVNILSGDDYFFLPYLACGVKGLVSVVSNLVPERLAALYDAWTLGNTEEARRIQYALLPLEQAMFMTTSPIPVKTASAMMGLCQEEFRLPLCAIAPALRPKLVAALKEAGLKLVRE